MERKHSGECQHCGGTNVAVQKLYDNMCIWVCKTCMLSWATFQPEAHVTRTLDSQRIIRRMAGLISTLEFQPSARHPEECIPVAERVFEMLLQDAQAANEEREG